jgi:hypothetical protein
MILLLSKGFTFSPHASEFTMDPTYQRSYSSASDRCEIQSAKVHKINYLHLETRLKV